MKKSLAKHIRQSVNKMCITEGVEFQKTFYRRAKKYYLSLNGKERQKARI